MNAYCPHPLNTLSFVAVKQNGDYSCMFTSRKILHMHLPPENRTVFLSESQFKKMGQGLIGEYLGKSINTFQQLLLRDKFTECMANNFFWCIAKEPLYCRDT